jgi:hypothetical protein
MTDAEADDLLYDYEGAVINEHQIACDDMVSGRAWPKSAYVTQFARAKLFKALTGRDSEILEVRGYPLDEYLADVAKEQAQCTN